jgi:hypothetical protein
MRLCLHQRSHYQCSPSCSPPPHPCSCCACIRILAVCVRTHAQAVRVCALAVRIRTRSLAADARACAFVKDIACILITARTAHTPAHLLYRLLVISLPAPARGLYKLLALSLLAPAPVLSPPSPAPAGSCHALSPCHCGVHCAGASTGTNPLKCYYLGLISHAMLSTRIMIYSNSTPTLPARPSFQCFCVALHLAPLYG